MAITLTKEPTNPCFSKNVIAYKVHTDTTLAVIGRLWVETSPYSETYEFVSDIKAIPDADGYCYYYLQQLLEEDVLKYDKPSFSQTAAVMPNICRRFKMEFYEYDPTALTLVNEIFGTDSFSNDINPYLTTGQDYVMILEKGNRTYDGISVFINIILSKQSLTPIYVLGDENWYSFNATYDHQYVGTFLQKGEKLSIYEGTPPSLSTSSVAFALLGGLEYDRFTILTENYFFWGQEDYDLIVDQNGNFIGAN